MILGLLEMCSEADWWVPSAKYGLPLTAGGDACRTSRHALAQVRLLTLVHKRFFSSGFRQSDSVVYVEMNFSLYHCFSSTISKINSHEI